MIDRKPEGNTPLSPLTTNQGVRIHDNQNSRTAGVRGPVLLEDYQMIEKIAHFDRERIPQRVVHAQGAGAHGYFETYGRVGDRPVGEFTAADFLQRPGERTPVFVRFSTVIHGLNSPETLRDPRGFAVKFYTREGNYDLVGNNLPVFFIRDGIKFPDVIHALKPAPQTNLQTNDHYWDFFSLTPEATHMLTWLFSNRGIPADYRHQEGFGVHTFKWVNARGEEIYVKYHWKPKQGVRNLTRAQAAEIQARDFQHATRDLFESIERGDYPEWELCVQLMPIELEDSLRFDPLDVTKTWPEDEFPLLPVGRMVLDRNPRNYFAEVEQVAFAPSVLVPGIELSADKMLQVRAFSYPDTQRYRLGANYAQLPINCPFAPVANNQRDGFMAFGDNGGSRINYEPNSLEGGLKEARGGTVSGHAGRLEGHVVRQTIDRREDFYQAGERYRSLSEADRDNLVDNLVDNIAPVRSEAIKLRLICNFARADFEFGRRVAEGLGIALPEELLNHAAH
ncbi:catalase [Deinobacterium chartae]|uniref:Catalase n=1 Tax=Deinobacterium chartae TaxID=521158 RepID=A0A841I528_9DEIO|nr:catalase [Deinobacterium chartae]MBB6098985.1 catalase [Deinobacterium chartae]